MHPFKKNDLGESLHEYPDLGDLGIFVADIRLLCTFVDETIGMREKWFFGLHYTDSKNESPL